MQWQNIGLYLKEKDGRKYMSGKATVAIEIPKGAIVMVKKNDRKKADNHPDYELSVGIPEQGDR